MNDILVLNDYIVALIRAGINVPPNVRAAITRLMAQHIRNTKKDKENES